MSTYGTSITDLACDLRDAGWADSDTRVRDGMAVCEWTRNGRKAWALVDTATNLVVGGQY
jgi:hypothetical protein